eukprot:TRINITY_DN2308_c0_g1_i1.p1 TRINITY_DN2308_c0_g1~~TRINITY_DN2308_c0_g1_i1.p1  ORF type:complete len:143 (-),score=35.03 TRINITY_DN2308_c0_g1_i1:69-497(-)
MNISNESSIDDIISFIMENDTNNHGPPPTSQLALQNEVVDIVITKKHLEKCSTCSICLEEFKLNEYARKIPCNHFFHDNCIVEWLTSHNTCPLCKYELPTLDYNYEEKKRLEREKKNLTEEESDYYNGYIRKKPNNDNMMFL